MKSARRVLDVLELVANNPGGLSIAQLSKESGLPRSTVHALVHYLTSRRYLHHPNDGAFTLGVKVLELGGMYAASLDITKEFAPIAGRIVADCGETVQMAVLDGRDVIYVAKEDGTQPVRLASYVGRRLPSHSTALGKALLAALTDQAVESVLGDREPLPAATPHTIATKSALSRELQAVRLSGFAHDNEEMTEGVQCLAGPVLDSSGKVMAAISTSFLSVRATPDRVEHLAELVVGGAQELSERMGYRGVWEPYRERVDDFRGGSP